MDKATITLTIDSERLKALEVFLNKENKTVEGVLHETLDSMYEEIVPEVVREFLVEVKPKRQVTKPRASHKEKGEKHQEVSDNGQS